MSFNVIIAGSRGFNDYERLKTVCDKLLANKLDEDVTIISGTARGADKLGERYAMERGFALMPVPADWERYGKSAGYRRNEEMAELAGPDGGLVAFWDGESRGTKHMIDVAKANGLSIRLIRI